MTIRHDPDAADHTFTRQEVMAARDADVPANVAVCPVEPRKPESGTHTTPEPENAT